MTGGLPSGRTLPRAASVVLLREGFHAGTLFELFMLRRPASARFAPGAYTFPGGVLEEQDYACVDLLRLHGNPAVAAVHARLGGADPLMSPNPATTAALLACAARELFEETGVLLARDRHGNHPALTGSTRWQRLRYDLLHGRRAFGALLAAEKLRIDPGDLIAFSHWITPEGQPIRYNTHFFLGVLPSEQAASHYATELAGGEWLTPEEGLARHSRGDFPLLPVQTKHLECFARFAALADLLAFARDKPLPPVLPVFDARRGESVLPKEIAQCW